MARRGRQPRMMRPPVAEARPKWRALARRALSQRWLVQIVVAALVVTLAAWQVSIKDLADAFTHVHYGWLMVALAVYVMSRLVHALEWQITLTKVGRAPFLGLFGGLLIGTLVNALVPASAGDIVKIQVVANRYGLPRAGLVASRGSEAVVNAMIMVIFIVVSFALPGVGFASPTVLWLLAGAMAGAFVATIVGSHLMPQALPRWRLLTRLPARWSGTLRRQWPHFREGLEVLRSPRLLTIAVLLNLFGWGVDILIYWAYGEAFRLHLPLSAYISVTVVIALITTFPITFGNVGTWELGIIGVLALYAVPSDQALAYALGTHVFSTAFNIALGVLAMWLMGVQPGDVFRMRPATAASEAS